MATEGINVKTATLRADIAQIIFRVCVHKTRATIHRYGDPVAVVVPIEEVEELDRLRRMYNIQQKGKESE